MIYAWRHKATGRMYDVQSAPSTIESLLTRLGWGEADDFERLEDVTDDMIPVNLEAVRAKRKQALNDEMHVYLSSVGFDPDSQSTLLAFQAKLDKIVRKGGALTAAQEAADDALDTVWDYIESILVYYKDRKEALDAAGDPALIGWDYSQFDAAHPGETLWSIKAKI